MKHIITSIVALAMVAGCGAQIPLESNGTPPSLVVPSYDDVLFDTQYVLDTFVERVQVLDVEGVRVLLDPQVEPWLAMQWASHQCLPESYRACYKNDATADCGRALAYEESADCAVDLMADPEWYAAKFASFVEQNRSGLARTIWGTRIALDGRGEMVPGVRTDMFRNGLLAGKVIAGQGPLPGRVGLVPAPRFEITHATSAPKLTVIAITYMPEDGEYVTGSGQSFEAQVYSEDAGDYLMRTLRFSLVDGRVTFRGAMPPRNAAYEQDYLTDYDQTGPHSWYIEQICSETASSPYSTLGPHDDSEYMNCSSDCGYWGIGMWVVYRTHRGWCCNDSSGPCYGENAAICGEGTGTCDCLPSNWGVMYAITLPENSGADGCSYNIFGPDMIAGFEYYDEHGTADNSMSCISVCYD